MPSSLWRRRPAVLSVIQSDYANATRQTIALATRGKTPGENQLRVDVFGVKNDNVALDSSLPDLPLKEAELAAEAQDALPDVPCAYRTFTCRTVMARSAISSARQHKAKPASMHGSASPRPTRRFR